MRVLKQLYWAGTCRGVEEAGVWEGVVEVSVSPTSLSEEVGDERSEELFSSFPLYSEFFLGDG